MLFTDLEVYSDVSITDVPFDVYSTHPSTRIILGVCAEDDGEDEVYEEKDVPLLLERIRNYEGQLNAWNVSYERAIFAHHGVPTDLSKWVDTMVLARYVGLPGALKKCVTVPELRIPAGDSTKSETALIKRFCMPFTPPKKSKDSVEELWAAFVEYCRRDVRSTRHIYNYLIRNFVFDAQEVGVWQLDQVINERGLPIDIVTAKHAAKEVDRIIRESKAKMSVLTGLENPNSVAQLLPWLQERGYRHNSLGKEYVQAAVEREADRLTPECRQVLTLRLDSAKSSVKKFSAIVEGTSPDGRSRNGYKHYGAHTGRWSGRGFQPQNLVRLPTIELELERLVRHEPATSLEALSTCIRPMIQASPGKKLVVADLNAIEVRGLWWLSGCESGLRVFEEGRCPYVDFGARFRGVPYSELDHKLEGLLEHELRERKMWRQWYKPPVLGCGYGLGPGMEKHLSNGTVEFTGLRGYAAGMGVVIDQKLSSGMVNTYRSEYHEVVEFWRYLEQAFYAAVINPSERHQVGYIHVGAIKDGLDVLAVYIELPSKRRIHYLNPRAWKGAKGIEIRFDGLRMNQWWSVSTWGGSLCENVVQAFSRDVLVTGMFRAEEDGLPIIGHSHDELISEVPSGTQCAVERLEYAMSDSIEWAPGCPLAAEGWEGERYAK